MNPPNLEAVEQVRRTLIDLAIHYGPRVLTALLILILGVVVARRVGRAAQRWLDKRELEPPMRKIIVQFASLLVLLLFFMMSLQNLGVELLPLLASLGVAGVGIGLATQGVLSNLAAGLTIIFTRPFRIGEYVALVGVEGQVDAIELLSTTLTHSDRSRIVIPNRKIVGEILHNYGKLRQLNLSVGVAYATDLNRALRVIDQMLARSPRVLKDPAPVVAVTALGESTVNISVCPWVPVADYVVAIGELNKALLEALREGGVELAFPQREVRLLTPIASA